MKTHKYQLVIEFKTTEPVIKHADALIQFEKGLSYFVECSAFNKGEMRFINETFEYGTGKTSLKKLTATKRSTARKP